MPEILKDGPSLNSRQTRGLRPSATQTTMECETQMHNTETNKRGQRQCELVPGFGNAFFPDSAILSVQKHKTTLFRTCAPLLLWTISIVVPTVMLLVFAVAVCRACRFDIVLVSPCTSTLDCTLFVCLTPHQAPVAQECHSAVAGRVTLGSGKLTFQLRRAATVLPLTYAWAFRLRKS